MSLKINDIIKLMEILAPCDLALDWDNVGLIIGDENANVNKILVSLDATSEVIDEAIKKNIDIIITHHPIYLKAPEKINYSTHIGKQIIKLIKNNISLYSAHTNLDIVTGGTNDELARILQLENVKILGSNDDNDLKNVCPDLGLIRTGQLKNEITLNELLIFIKANLHLDAIRYVGDSNKKINNVSICTGSGSSSKFFEIARNSGSDVYITSDIKFHDAQIAHSMDLCLVDATHYATEQPIVDKIVEYLKSNIGDFNIEIIKSKINGQVFKNVF